MDKPMIEWQLFFMCGMFSATFISYLTPIIIIRRQRSDGTSAKSKLGLNGPKTLEVLSICNCLSAGIFLGICFINLIPYVEREFIEIFEKFKIKTHFPIGLFVVVLGLLVVLTLDSILRHFLLRASAPVLHLDEESNKICQQNEEKQELIEVLNDDKESEEFIKELEPKSCPYCSPDSHNFDIKLIDSYLTFFLLVFAKSIHSFFEGLALGLQTDGTKAFHLFIGIILHECLVAFALGLNSQRIECQMKTNIKFSIVFSLTIPIGIVLGVVLAYTPGLLGRSISGVFQGLAAGTFIDVTFHELIPSEFIKTSPEKHYNIWQKMLKIFVLFIGFSIICLITGFIEESQLK